MLDGPSVVAGLKAAGVTHVVWVPDSELGKWEAALTGHDGIPLIRVCREGEAFAVAAGLHIGGQRPLIVIQCTGLFEAGDALRNVIHDMGLPLFMIVGVRSHKLLKESKTTDTCPVYTEPILQAWRIPYVVLEDQHTAADLVRAYEAARNENRPGAALLAE